MILKKIISIKEEAPIGTFSSLKGLTQKKLEPTERNDAIDAEIAEIFKNSCKNYIDLHAEILEDLNSESPDFQKIVDMCTKAIEDHPKNSLYFLLRRADAYSGLITSNEPTTLTKRRLLGYALSDIDAALKHLSASGDILDSALAGIQKFELLYKNDLFIFAKECVYRVYSSLSEFIQSSQWNTCNFKEEILKNRHLSMENIALSHYMLGENSFAIFMRNALLEENPSYPLIEEIAELK